MSGLPFYKYASNGNNFVIIDEIEQCLVPEAEKAALATTICNPATGIGCDTLIFIQRYHPQHLPGVTIAGGQPPDYVMRIFEQNGFESDCCGNGLLCLGRHLATTYAITRASIATEIPSGQATLRRVTKIADHTFQVAMGNVTLPGKRLINVTAVTHQLIHPNLYALQDVATIEHCYFTYSGTPHIVIFTHPSDPRFHPLFGNSDDNSGAIIETIGLHYNRLTNIFPLGTNVNFAAVLDETHIAYRCFERGVYRETYACGTGATAVAAAAQASGRCRSQRLSLLPSYARMHPCYNTAEIIIEQQHAHYTLTSQAHRLAQGQYHCLPGNNETRRNVIS